MEASRSSETQVDFNQITWRHITVIRVRISRYIIYLVYLNKTHLTTKLREISEGYENFRSQPWLDQCDRKN